MTTPSAALRACLLAPLFLGCLKAESTPSHLPGELSADQVLDGEYPFPPSPTYSFSYDKRLVICSRSVAPDFHILLFPHLAGDPLPVTEWNADRTALTLTVGSQVDRIAFERGADGRTRLKPDRKDHEAIPLVP